MHAIRSHAELCQRWTVPSATGQGGVTAVPCATGTRSVIVRSWLWQSMEAKLAMDRRGSSGDATWAARLVEPNLRRTACSASGVPGRIAPMIATADSERDTGRSRLIPRTWASLAKQPCHRHSIATRRSVWENKAVTIATGKLGRRGKRAVGAATAEKGPVVVASLQKLRATGGPVRPAAPWKPNPAKRRAVGQ